MALPAIMMSLAGESADHKTIMIYVTHFEAHRDASHVRRKKGGERQIGCTKGACEKGNLRYVCLITFWIIITFN